ncbi:hypothetical protein [Gymnodinialimonas sp.]
MFKPKTRYFAATLIAASALAAPAMADTVGVSRCNVSGGSSASALHFVNGGERFIVPVGTSGLTRNVVMNERRALAWAAASGLFPEGTSYGGYANVICGMAYEDAEETQTAGNGSFTDDRPTTELTECTSCE